MPMRIAQKPRFKAPPGAPRGSTKSVRVADAVWCAFPSVVRSGVDGAERASARGGRVWAFPLPAPVRAVRGATLLFFFLASACPNARTSRPPVVTPHLDLRCTTTEPMSGPRWKGARGYALGGGRWTVPLVCAPNILRGRPLFRPHH